MTSRLKRKLGDLGIDPSSARANESFCLIGTPLPPLEKSKDTGEFVPLWKQEVRDEKGRRRLHGAFTGGFSAGYFNTVGSKEGWTPSTFISSRSDRAKQKVARPEDFMDEEDLAELNDGRTLVDTTEEMDFPGPTQGKGNQASEQDSISAAIGAAMLPPPTLSPGALILKKMGWKVGQGIGPRLTYHQRKRQDLELGLPTPAEEDEEEASKHTYAPRDTGIVVAERKDNSYGLGYRPGMGLNESLGVKGGKAGPKLAAGFGLGVLNDTEDDDLDVYDGDTPHSRTRMAYDAMDREDDDRIVIGSKSERSQGKLKPSVASPSQTFQDGRPVLSGFILVNEPVVETRWFPFPEIPKGWTPDPKRVWEKYKENIDTSRNIPSTRASTQGKWKTGISADQRGAILGETPLPSAPRSVFEYMSQKDRERLQNIAVSASAPTTASGSNPPPEPTITIPRTEPHVAQAALRGFQPFTSDPAKQARYIAYLHSQASPDSVQPPLQPNPGQKIYEFNKELADYATAALIFKPVSGAMAGRFTSATVVDRGPKLHEGLHVPSAEDKSRESSPSSNRPAEAEETNPKAHAAKMGLYGLLTREAKPWQPAGLLCKRFGVKDPTPKTESESAASAPAPAMASGSWVPDPVEASPYPKDHTLASGSGSAKRNGPRDLENIGLGEDEDQGRDVLSYQRPAMEIFKAIFASDEEDSSDDEARVSRPIDGSTGTVDDPRLATTSSIPRLHHEPVSSASVPSGPLVASIHSESTEQADHASFRPTFIPRSDKPKRAKERDKKDKRKTSSRLSLVSFELDEDGGESASRNVKPKKRRRDPKHEHGSDGDEGMWVEKPPPGAVTDLQIGAPPSLHNEASPGGRETLKGRKRAIDFM